MGIDYLLMKSELSLTLIIFIILFLKVTDFIKGNSSQLIFINVLLLLNFIHGFLGNNVGILFDKMYQTNMLFAFEKNILNLGMLLISMQAYDYLKSHKHLLEFYILILCTLLGMQFMISSGNFLMFYLGLELASIPLAALCNYDLERLKSSESAMKLILSSAFASAILLFGISFLYGSTGTLDFAEMAMRISKPGNGINQIQIFSFVLVFIGFAFKLSAVPFHLWTADVYEGAPIPVTSYLSVISKGSIVFIFMTVLGTVFRNLESTWYNMLYIIILMTITIGNLFALRQNNMKRFLAFSSVTQVGYILLGISSGTNVGVSSAIFFLLVYTFSNLGAFGVVAMVSNQTGKENISDYKGFYEHNKFAGWVLAISLFSLAGIPPTAGFFGKMFLVTAGASKADYLLVSLAVLNMVISLYYYLRVVKAIFIEKNDEPLGKIGSSITMKLALIVCLVGVIGIGFANGLFEYINTIALK